MDKALTYFDAFTCIGPEPHHHPRQRWSLDHLLAEMDYCAIAGAMVSATASRLYDPMAGNRQLSDQLDQHDRLFALWNVMPHWTGEFPEPAELIRLLASHGVRAVTACPKSNGWRVCSRSSAPLFEALSAAEIPVVIDFRETDEAAIEQLLERFPRLPLVLVGLPWSRTRWLVPLLLEHKQLHLTFDHFQVNRALEWLVEHGCEDQLLFASYGPRMAMGAHRCLIDYAEVSDATRRKIAGGNLQRLLRGQSPPPADAVEAADAIVAAAWQGRPCPTPVLDMHAHMLDEGLDGGGGYYTMFEGGPTRVKHLAQRMGVDGIGIMSWIGPVGVHADAGNRCVQAALDACPDFYWGLATFDPVRDSAETTRAKMDAIFADRRFLGLKPYPFYGRHYDHPAYRVWWAFGEEHGLYALLHVNREDLSEIDALAPKYPNLTFVVAHCGGSFPMAEQAIRVANAYPNVLLEITLTPVWLGILEYLVDGAGADKVLYGSDLPMRDPRQQFGWVLYSRLDVEDKRKVLGLNAQRLLGRLRARRPLHGALQA